MNNVNQMLSGLFLGGNRGWLDPNPAFHVQLRWLWSSFYFLPRSCGGPVYAQSHNSTNFVFNSIKGRSSMPKLKNSYYKKSLSCDMILRTETLINCMGANSPTLTQKKIHQPTKLMPVIFILTRQTGSSSLQF